MKRTFTAASAGALLVLLLTSGSDVDRSGALAQVGPAAPLRMHSPIHVRRNPDGSPEHGLRNQWVSSNWAGYEVANFQTGKKYTQAQMTWVVPSVTYGQSTDSTSSTEYSANWVGIGGFCENRLCVRGDNTLIQLGTEQDVAPDGTAQYYAWYEMLPAAETLIPNLTIKPGDIITATLSCGSTCSQKKQTWTLTMQDGAQFWSGNFTYASSELSAEWIEEAPYSGGILPLADFGTASFVGPNGADGGTPAVSFSQNAIQMKDPWGQWATPSATSVPNFSACWGFENFSC